MYNEKLTLYNFNLLPEEEQYDIVFNQGTFLDISLNEGKRYVVYAVEKFFVEVEYDVAENRIVNKRAFKAGEILNKYSNIESYLKLSDPKLDDMSLYDPPLLPNRKKDWNTSPILNNALEGFTVDYFYTGKRINKQLIELEVCTIIEDAQDNIFMRYCHYSGNKEKWKEVIQDQLKRQLRDLGVDEGFVKAETRNLMVDKEYYFIAGKFDNLKREYIHKIETKFI